MTSIVVTWLVAGRFSLPQSLQSDVEACQPHVDRLNQDMMSVKQLVARTRPGVARTHPDVQRMEKEADDTIARWETLSVHLADRLRNMENAMDLLQQYHVGMAREEPWLQDMQRRVKDLPSSAPNNVEDAQKRLQPTMASSVDVC